MDLLQKVISILSDFLGNQYHFLEQIPFVSVVNALPPRGGYWAATSVDSLMSVDNMMFGESDGKWATE